MHQLLIRPRCVLLPVRPSQTGPSVRTARGPPKWEYWVKEAIDGFYSSGALRSQVIGLKRLGDVAPEHLFENGRLIIRDVGNFDGTISEFMQIKLLGSVRMGTIFNDIWPRNIGANSQIFDPALHPVHQAALWATVALGTTVAGLFGYAASAD